MAKGKNDKQYVRADYVEAEQFVLPDQIPEGFVLRHKNDINKTPFAHKKSIRGESYDVFLLDTDWVVRDYNGEQRVKNENFCRRFVAIEDVHTIKLTDEGLPS